MAKAAEAPKSGGSVVIPVLVATLLVGGAGAFFGMQLPALVEKSVAPVEKHDGKSKPADAPKIIVRSLPPITTNLAVPSSTWVRLEVSAVITEELGPEGDVLMKRIAEDVVAYLRTVALDQIEGPSGFQHLREDLNDRVRIRSQSKVQELLIEAFVVQ